MNLPVVLAVMKAEVHVPVRIPISRRFTQTKQLNFIMRYDHVLVIARIRLR